MNRYWIYIMGSVSRNTIYVGVTDNLLRRVAEHRNGIYDGFTKKYRCSLLLYFEEYGDIRDAIAREKEIKGWRRIKKETLIIAMNPARNDLAKDWW